MAEVINKLIRGIGITPIEDLPKNPLLFSETMITETMVLPKSKPDIEQLLSITAEPQIISMRLIETVKGISNEGQHLRGYKLIVEMKLQKIVRYIADEPSQKVHAVHFDGSMNSVFLVVPENIIVGFPNVTVPIGILYKQGDLVVVPYLEDIYGEIRDKRTIYTNISVLINADTI